MKLVWLRKAYAKDFDAWDLSQGLINLGYVTLFVEDIPQVIFVIILGVSGDIAVFQTAFTMVAIVCKCSQDMCLAHGFLAIDLIHEPKGDIEDGGASLPP